MWCLFLDRRKDRASTVNSTVSVDESKFLRQSTRREASLARPHAKGSNSLLWCPCTRAALATVPSLRVSQHRRQGAMLSLPMCNPYH